MKLREQINQDLIVATKSGDASRTAVIRLIKNAITNEEIKVRRELSDEEAQKVLNREAKQRRDSIQAYREGNRQDLAKVEEQELAVITQYLPQQMDDEELGHIVGETLAELGSQTQMGQLIGAVMKRVAGRADGGRVSAAVRERLES